MTKIFLIDDVFVSSQTPLEQLWEVWLTFCEGHECTCGSLADGMNVSLPQKALEDLAATAAFAIVSKVIFCAKTDLSNKLHSILFCQL